MKKFLQDSDALSRRALLNGGTLVGIGALLAACGAQVNNGERWLIEATTKVKPS